MGYAHPMPMARAATRDAHSWNSGASTADRRPTSRNSSSQAERVQSLGAYTRPLFSST